MFATSTTYTLCGPFPYLALACPSIDSLHFFRGPRTSLRADFGAAALLHLIILISFGNLLLVPKCCLLVHTLRFWCRVFFLNPSLVLSFALSTFIYSPRWYPSILYPCVVIP
ncbi:hypothetical protein C8J57DRAFT_1347891 [Mycena rebaudengoi]|nr:hypothetical protein C8J57DRAFT_1347891 [Mycena rebaudengoi]